MKDPWCSEINEIIIYSTIGLILRPYTFDCLYGKNPDRIESSVLSILTMPDHL